MFFPRKAQLLSGSTTNSLRPRPPFAFSERTKLPLILFVSSTMWPQSFPLAYIYYIRNNTRCIYTLVYTNYSSFVYCIPVLLPDVCVPLKPIGKSIPSIGNRPAIDWAIMNAGITEWYLLGAQGANSAMCLCV